MAGCVERIPGIQVSLSFSGQSPESVQSFVRSVELEEAHITLSDLQLLSCRSPDAMTALLRWLSPVSFAHAHHVSIHGEEPRNLGRIDVGEPLNLLEPTERHLGTTPALGGRWCGLVASVKGRGMVAAARLSGTMFPRAGMDGGPFEWLVDDGLSLEFQVAPFTTSENEIVELHLQGDLESAFELLEGVVEPTVEELSTAVSRALRLSVR